MNPNTTYSVVDHIVSLRAIIKRREGANACRCSAEPGDPWCDDCREIVSYRDRLRALEREPEGEELLAQELAEFKTRCAARQVFEAAFVGPRHYTDPYTMNDKLPF